MQIGYSEDVLYSNIAKQFDEIENEIYFLKDAFYNKNYECLEESAEIIQDCLVSMLESLNNLKGESL